jgi:hypothetical protein
LTAFSMMFLLGNISLPPTMGFLAHVVVGVG